MWPLILRILEGASNCVQVLEKPKSCPRLEGVSQMLPEDRQVCWYSVFI